MCKSPRIHSEHETFVLLQMFRVPLSQMQKTHFFQRIWFFALRTPNVDEKAVRWDTRAFFRKLRLKQYFSRQDSQENPDTASQIVDQFKLEMLYYKPH